MALNRREKSLAAIAAGVMQGQHDGDGPKLAPIVTSAAYY
jgi:hypothetical protein